MCWEGIPRNDCLLGPTAPETGQKYRLKPGMSLGGMWGTGPKCNDKYSNPSRTKYSTHPMDSPLRLGWAWSHQDLQCTHLKMQIPFAPRCAWHPV